MPAIRCQGLTKRYGKITALDSLDLTVEEGVIFGFLGPNGAGKTTTLRLLTGLGRPTGGRAWVAGEEVHPYSSTLRSRVGYLPEEPAFYGWMTGREYLDFVGDLYHLPHRKARVRSEELLELVDLRQVASRRVGGYSRGMRQRLAIAQALLNRPAVLFLDEPTSALDPMGRAEVLETLIRLKEQATTVFLSSHILADVERICDTVGIINQGKLVVQAGVTELRQRFARSVFEVEFEEPAAPFVGLLEPLPWVGRVDAGTGSGGLKVRIHARDVTRAKQELPKLVSQSGLTLRQYQVVLPTLEEVFIELLGERDR
ncbi:MAG: ABC transporter ATP-binding protein [Chloroflexota bacterium]